MELKKKTAVSWSGGKDGCMALHKLAAEGVEIACLITTVPAETGRTFGHGEKIEAIKQQSLALNIPVHFISCTYESYTDHFIGALKELKAQYSLTAIAFGDLYLDEHREWGEKASAAAGLEPLYPLWMEKEKAHHALQQFAESGYKAAVIRVRDDKLDSSWLGMEVNQRFIDRVLETDICPMGEAGEYHTFVYDGPLFTKKIDIEFGNVLQLETTKRLELEKTKLREKTTN